MQPFGYDRRPKSLFRSSRPRPDLYTTRASVNLQHAQPYVARHSWIFRIPWIMLPQPWIKGFSMDARKCSSEPCIRFMEKYPRMTLADPWMGGFQVMMKKIKFSNNNLRNMTLSSLIIIN